MQNFNKTVGAGNLFLFISFFVLKTYQGSFISERNRHYFRMGHRESNLKFPLSSDENQRNSLSLSVNGFGYIGAKATSLVMGSHRIQFYVHIEQPLSSKEKSLSCSLSLSVNEP